MIRTLVRPAACALAAAAVTAILLAVPASTPAQAASIAINNCTSPTLVDNGGGNFTLTCAASGGGGSVACSISLSVGSPVLTTAETLIASCTGQTGSVSYTWSGGGSGGCPAIVQEGASPNKADVAAPGGSTALNCTYSLVASDNGTNTSSSPTKTISYSTGGGGGGGGGGNISCSGFTATHVITAAWVSNGLYYTSNAGGFGPNDAIVVKFTTSSVTTSTKTGSFNAVEFSDPPTPRYGALSDTACDFSTGLPVVNGAGSRTVFAGDVGASSFYSLVAPKAGAATLQPNTTYYINIANMPGSCGGSCNMQITVNKVPGT